MDGEDIKKSTLLDTKKIYRRNLIFILLLSIAQSLYADDVKAGAEEAEPTIEIEELPPLGNIDSSCGKNGYNEAGKVSLFVLCIKLYTSFIHSRC